MSKITVELPDFETIYQNWHVARLTVNLFLELHGDTPLAECDKADIHNMVSNEIHWELMLCDMGYMVTTDGDVYLRDEV